MELEADRALLEAYRRGDADALSRIFRHFSGRVLEVLARSAVGPLDLDAAHQETFMRAFSEAARLQYDGLHPFEPYLLGIARRAAVDVLRAHGKLHRELVPIDHEPAAASVPSEHDTPEEAALRAETLAVVRAFLLTLSGEEHRFATARFIEGRSQEQAGLEVGWSRQTARTREQKLKTACLRFLTERGWLGASPPSAVALTVLSLFLVGRL